MDIKCPYKREIIFDNAGTWCSCCCWLSLILHMDICVRPEYASVIIIKSEKKKQHFLSGLMLNNMFFFIFSFCSALSMENKAETNKKKTHHRSVCWPATLVGRIMFGRRIHMHILFSLADLNILQQFCHFFFRCCWFLCPIQSEKINDPNARMKQERKKNHSRIRIDPICIGLLEFAVFVYFSILFTCNSQLSISHPFRCYLLFDLSLLHYFMSLSLSCLIKVHAHMLLLVRYLVFALPTLGPANKLKWFQLYSVFAHEYASM